MAPQIYNFTPWQSLVGGVIIGIAASLHLLTTGRIMGASGVVNESSVASLHLLTTGRIMGAWGVVHVFLASMTAVGSFTMLINSGHAFGSNPPSVGDDPGLALILPIAAGLLCGFGSQLGSGCTSGHGVCGLLRFSPRSCPPPSSPSPFPPSSYPSLPNLNQLGSGCTSGHGVCGLPRFSLRSAVGVATFMATGAATSMTLGAIATGATAANRPPGEPIPATNTWLLVLAVCATAVGAIIAYRCPYCNEFLDGGAASGANGGAAGGAAGESASLAKPACSSGACSLSPSAPSASCCSALLHPVNVLRASLVTGAIFGIGLALSGMCNPYKVKDFFDPVHGWDPSLAFVMGLIPFHPIIPRYLSHQRSSHSPYRCNPYKVKDFLDPVHGWDPSLAFVTTLTLPIPPHSPYRCNPYKVKDFLDPVHGWDPSLAFVTTLTLPIPPHTPYRCNPYKVKDFLDPVHGWDPSLAFVMGGAVVVNVVTFRFILARPNPLFDTKFYVPSRNDITWELVVGSAIFGIGECHSMFTCKV
ncbi:unnamed protein product [Closterium sp. Naga37s-1]|nr:unnamed protein product [Closterium sp. Naga37s-1]